MHRINRSAHAPVGTAVVLFLGLVILPVSQRVTGIQISFSPRLSAAIDAWQQIAEVFGASYHPAPASELSVVKDLDTDPSNRIEGSGSADRSDLACAHKAEEWPATVLGVTNARSLNTASVRRSASKSLPRRSLLISQVATVVSAKAIKASFERQAPTIGALGALRVAMLKPGELLKSVDNKLFNFTFEPIGEVQNPGSKNVRVFVRLRRAVAGSTAKAAERKVFSALASARRRECDRAILTGMTVGNPDHSEF
jgi:hypothetical protein